MTVRADGTFAVHLAEMKTAVTGLTRDIMTLQAEGDYAAAKALRDSAAVIRPPVREALEKLSGVPVDIEPRFTTAERLVAGLTESGGPSARASKRRRRSSRS